MAQKINVTKLSDKKLIKLRSKIEKEQNKRYYKRTEACCEWISNDNYYPRCINCKGRFKDHSKEVMAKAEELYGK